MKLIFFLLLASNLLSGSLENKIIGKWLSNNKKEIIEIYGDKGSYEIKISWLKYPKYRDGTKINGKDFSNKDRIDIKNPDKNRRDRLLIGLSICNNLKYNYRKNIWIGNIYNPNSGKKYYTEIKFKDNKLEMRYYTSIFYKVKNWSKEI